MTANYACSIISKFQKESSSVGKISSSTISNATGPNTVPCTRPRLLNLESNISLLVAAYLTFSVQNFADNSSLLSGTEFKIQSLSSKINE